MISILVTGDFCPINRIEDVVLKGDFSALLNDFFPIIQNADLAITNLECPLTDSRELISKTGPALKASPRAAELLNQAGFNLVTLANNHIMDFGLDGLHSTLKVLESNNISYVGAGNIRRDANRPFQTKIKGKSIAIINIAENEFSTTNGDYPGANPLSLVSNYHTIKETKSNNDLVFVIYHGGNEEYNLPSPRLKETLRFFVEAGASAVVAHHSHRYSGFEIYKDTPIFYGLGNFLFDYKDNKGIEWQHGIALLIKIESDNTSFEIIPISQCDSETLGVRMLKDTEKQAVTDKIEELNSIIADDLKLEMNFQSFIRIKKKQYQHFLEPHTINFLHGLMGRGYIPSLLSKEKRKLYLNLIRCESHRDVILRILEDENRHS